MSQDQIIKHIKKVAECPSFSTFEERLHPYIIHTFNGIEASEKLDTDGNNLIFRIEKSPHKSSIAITAHLDKINHYGEFYPNKLPVSVTEQFIEGAMDDSAGVGLLLTLAEASKKYNWPNLLFFLSEMEESKGLREHPERLKNGGEGYTHGMGARHIAQHCRAMGQVPNAVITLDTTPLFKGESGIALYAKHWELTDLVATESLKKATKSIIKTFKRIDEEIELHNNTNDYLHYGYEFNKEGHQDVVSIAMEPSIYPYHQKGERVFINDIYRLYDIIKAYLNHF